MAKMTVEELIKKFGCELAMQDGKEGLRIWGKPTANQLEQLKDSKPEIIIELKRRAAAEADRKAIEKAKRDAEREEIKHGTIKIKPSYTDGEYLMGYEVFGQAAKLMEEIGLADHVSGWGYHIPDKAVEALGTEFTYQEAVEYMRPAKEAAEAKKAEKEAARQAKFDEAKATGKPVLLRQWMSDCCDRREECSTDAHYEYAMPDGSIKHDWTHTW